MLYIDPATRDALVAEFRAAPFGPHAPLMQKVLQHLRIRGGAGQPSIVVTVPYREWAIGTFSPPRGTPVAVEDARYDDLGEAFAEVFERRLDTFLANQETVDG